MDTSDAGSGRNASSVNDKVADLPIEDIDGGPIERAATAIGIAFDHGKRAGGNDEAAACFEGW